MWYRRAYIPRLQQKLKSVYGASGYQVILLEFGSNDLVVGCDMVWSVVETLRSCYGVSGKLFGSWGDPRTQDKIENL